MTRREWEELAALIRSEIDDWEHGGTVGSPYDARVDGAVTALTVFATQLANRLSSKHSRFDVARFLTACGIKCD